MIASRCIFGAALFHKNGDSAYPSTNGRRMRGSRWLVEEEYSAPEIIRGFRSLGERYPWPLAGAARAKGSRQLMAFLAILAVPVSNPYESTLSTGRKRKQPVAFATSCLSLLRKKGDSNPRYPVRGIPVFETSAFSHSAILP